ncbi:Na/Pi symporter [Halioxenophilus sp. WMMB6]|uniref:Na/Pi symporter n=1 Tax=Halioxenophilus sp. WMMB6 TaxID=3073815 RepID=UPI00295E46A1|nr:Na/Pi symporter [Halioxenophilus sp. WMMB6]
MNSDSSVNPSNSATPSASNTTHHPTWQSWLFVIGLIYLLLVAVSMIGSGFKLAAGSHAESLFEFARNPVTGLVMGIVATALIQSSSTVTSIIVGLVAGGLPVSIAIPMVMGANIGTTITNTIVSLGHVRQGEEFRRAFAAATVHDFFNLLAVVIFLPLEMMFGLLEKVGGLLANLLVGGGSLAMGDLNFMKAIVSPPVKSLLAVLKEIMPNTLAGSLVIALGVLAIFVSITFIGKLLKMLMVGRAKELLHRAIGRGPITGIGSGTLMTVLVQSSSTTTSLIVPLAGSGVFTLRQIYPFTLGANIGTCITGILAATAITGTNSVLAMEIAMVHFAYNFLGVIVIYTLPWLREIPLTCAEALANAAMKNKLVIAAYLLLVFLVIPLIFVGISQLFE